MASMKISLPGVFKRLARDCPGYASMLEEIERHLRETIQGKHTLQEFAEHYCLLDKPPAAETVGQPGSG